MRAPCLAIAAAAAAAVATTAVLPQGASAFYLPGVSPQTFVRGTEVPVFMNALTSVDTHLPMSLPSVSPPFCAPEKPVYQSENLGQVLSGSSIVNTDFQVVMEPDAKSLCKVLCYKELTKEETDKARTMIDQLYVFNPIVDNLPSRTENLPGLSSANPSDKVMGVPVGYVLEIDDGGASDEEQKVKLETRLFNHWKIRLGYHDPGATVVPTDNTNSLGGDGPNGLGRRRLAAAKQGYRITEFVISPYSRAHTWDSGKNRGWTAESKLDKQSCDSEAGGKGVDDNTNPLILSESGEARVLYTYDVEWFESKVSWASRWDVYLGDEAVHGDVHWFNILNALLVVVFLTGVLGIIMARTLYKDIEAYTRVKTEEELEEEAEERGWKLVHASVFRPPSFMPMLFCATVGSGVQMFLMTCCFMPLAAIGFVSPANRGSLMAGILVLWLLMGSPAGYLSARLYKTFAIEGSSWQKGTLLTAFFYPMYLFLSVFVLNLFVWGTGSSGAIPFSSMLAIIVLWFLISVPLVFFGAWLGYGRDAYKFPVKTQDIPRPIPEQPWYMGEIVTLAVGGLMPFGAVFVEFFIILNSIWLDRYYYVFGFLFIVFIVLVVTCAEVSIVLCYFQLCGEDYRWWWRSFLAPGFSAVYIFIYCIIYYFQSLTHSTFVPTVLYFGYSFIASTVFFLITGICGFIACFWFTMAIYESIADKVD